MIIDIERKLESLIPNVVLVQGDTNSVLAGSIATSKMEIDLGHVEAGLRNFNHSMPEEINRIVADHVGDHLFAPTNQSAQQLRTEGIDADRICVTGNTIVDAIYQHIDMAKKRSSILDQLQLSDREYCLLTIHRAENVDRKSTFESILKGIQRFAKNHNLPVVYPAHPRSQERIAEFEISVPDRIKVIDPLDYFDFLRLEARSSIVFTDSGGVQEEVCVLGIPCVTIRTETERPETVAVGANTVSGVESKGIEVSGDEMLNNLGSWKNPFGDGNASERLISYLESSSLLD